MAPRTPLFRPESYFENRWDAMLPAIGVFALYIVGSIILFMAILDALVAQIEFPPSRFVAALNDVMATVVVISVVLSIVALLVVAAIMHVLSGSGADGSFADAVAVAGWAYAPNAIFLPLRYVHARLQIQQLSIDAVDSARLASQFEAVRSQVTAVSMVISLVVIAWSVYILAKGTARTHDVTLDETIWPALLIGVGAFVMQFLA